MALITCPECNNNISSMAMACPHCGFPLRSVKLSNEPKEVLNKANPKPKRDRKYKKLPNGFGSIQKLSGKRRKPFAAYPATKEYKNNGSAVKQKALGYFETWHIAYDALFRYNALSEKQKKAIDKAPNTLTYKDVYELYYAKKFKKEIAEQCKNPKLKKTSLQYTAISGFKNSSALHNKIFSEIKADDFQEVIDNCPLKHASKENIVYIFKQVSKFALEKDYINKDYSQFISIDSEDDDENGVPFNKAELKILWNHKNDPAVQMILIMIYSGFRIKAYEELEIDLGKKTFYGGVKAKYKRVVPIHSAIQKFLNNEFLNNFNSYDFRQYVFYDKLSELGVMISDKGTKHTPHDCRHTFSWLCDLYKVDEVSKHMLMGHALNGDVEKVKYSHRTFEDLQNAIELIKK